MLIRIFGIDIERKTDILAFAAFLISLSGVLYNLTIFIQGAKVNFITPELVMLKKFTYDDKGEQYLAIIAPLAYVNSGTASHNAVIKKEKVSFTINSKSYEFFWQYFVSTYSKNNKLIYKIKDGAQPFSLNAGSAVVHETHFSPRLLRYSEQGKNFLKLKDFVKSFEFLLSEENPSKEAKVKFVFSIEILNDDDKQEECLVELSRSDIQRLRDPAEEWVTLGCWQEK